jgi:hypothetical protein
MASPATSTGTRNAIEVAYARAIERATTAKIVAWRDGDEVFHTTSASSDIIHTVRVTGARWYDLSCTCAGSNHISFQHRAAVVFARKYGVYAVKPTATGDPLAAAFN